VLNNGLLWILVVIAGIGWAVSAIGWWRVFATWGDPDAVRRVAFIMMFTCALTAGAAASAAWSWSR
jgi:hypothetical protein